MLVKWKITAEYRPIGKMNTQRYVWYITSVEDKSTLWRNIHKKLYKYSWWRAYKSIRLSTIFEIWDKNTQWPCFRRGQ